MNSLFSLDPLDGCRHYVNYGDEVQDHWLLFSKKMNSALKDSSKHGPIVAAAHEAFNGLKRLYEALHPISSTVQPPHATQINPEAGNHPMPDDEREIQAALEASTQIWNRYAYYSLRYGQRGKRFSDSDTFWLVTLTQVDSVSIIKQVRWLGRLLASHGMPQIMLEYTLLVLHERLVSAVPERAAAYEKLKTAAEDMSRMRNSVINAEVSAAIASDFDRRIGPDLAREHAGTGELLVASVADDMNGIESVAGDFQKWLTDKRNFSDVWIAAVTETFTMARGAAIGQSK